VENDEKCCAATAFFSFTDARKEEEKQNLQNFFKRFFSFFFVFGGQATKPKKGPVLSRVDRKIQETPTIRRFIPTIFFLSSFSNTRRLFFFLSR
jgi:hypothetical protein